MTLASFSFTSRWRPVVRVGIGDTRTPAGAGVWGTSTWGAAGSTWNGGEPIWQDVTCFCYSADWDTGRDWSIDRFAPGMATVRLTNPDGWATDESDPTRTLRPGRHVMIAVADEVAGTETSLFRGFVDHCAPVFDPEQGDSVVIVAIDGVGELGLHQLAAPYDAPVGAGDTGDVRFRRILGFYGWPAKWTGAVDPSGVVMAGSLFDQAFAEELGITADSEGGAVVCDLLGRVCFRSRDWLTWPAGAGVVWDIGNSGAAGEVCPTGFDLSDDRADVANLVRYGNGDGETATAIDPVSQALYGVVPYVRDDLICSDVGQLQVLADRTAATRAPGGDRIRAVTLEGATDPERLVPMFLAADVSASPPIRANLRLVRDGMSRFDQLGVLQRVSHRIERDAWTVRFGFDRSDVYVAEVARWGAGRWGEATWGSAARVRHLVREVLSV